ncbi:hypothetical protein M2103_001711 [Ereboglobus sp. PH5-5]|uniref:hypothetical protein n=1 Tax=Ereboglobus sp. PH5-5 TaxID=2940529 RepID=UPI002406AAEF|nr:hypothetical protein [Ereboglobus sp. PH5-5]MDF9833487.1 hypothetical protein [Ereboglobus sp. PH5-5]
MNSARRISVIIGLHMLFFLAAPAFAAPKPAPVPPDSDIVNLPTYTVTDVRILPPPESWRYAAIPGFEILSNASNHTTKRFLKEFQRVQIGMALIWPEVITAKPNVPTLVLFCANNSFRAFMPDKRPAEDMFITPTSLFVEDKERGAIIINFDTFEIFADNGSRFIIDPYAEFSRQYSRFVMHRANGGRPIPLWLETGLSRLFTTIELEKKTLEFGQIEGGFTAKDFSVPIDYTHIDDGNTIGMETPYALRPFQSVDSANGNINGFPHTTHGAGSLAEFTSRPKSLWVFSIEKLFSDNPDDRKIAYWSTECYAFLHMCLYGEQKKYQQAVLDFAKLACARPVTEEDFIRCFGKDYKTMTNVLRNYVNIPNHQYVQLKPTRNSAPLPRPRAVAFREATQAEVGRIKGETLRLAGHPEASRQELIAPYLRKKSDAGLLASLGLLESLEGRKERARKFLEAAARENAIRPRAYVELARLRLDEALADPKGENGRLDADQTAAVLEPLYIARTQPPSMEEVYMLIGSAWSHSAVPPAPGHLNALLEGTLIFPKNTGLLYQAAELLVQNGDTQIGRQLIRLGLAVSTNQATRKQFEVLRAKLPQNSDASLN